MTGLEKTRGNIEAGGVRSSHLCDVLQIDDSGGAVVWGIYVGPIDVHEEAASGVLKSNSQFDQITTLLYLCTIYWI